MIIVHVECLSLSIWPETDGVDVVAVFSVAEGVGEGLLWL